MRFEFKFGEEMKRDNNETNKKSEIDINRLY